MQTYNGVSEPADTERKTYVCLRILDKAAAQLVVVEPPLIDHEIDFDTDTKLGSNAYKNDHQANG